MVKTRLKKIMLSSERRLLEKELELNIDPKIVEHYLVPFQRDITKVGKAKNLFIKLHYYIGYQKKPVVISKALDPKNDLFKNTEKSQFINELWLYNLDYTKTKRYLMFRRQILEGKCIKLKNKYRLCNEEDLNIYFKDYKNLLTSMREKGYLTNLKQDNLLIWIGPSGQPVKGLGGRHRLAAAQVTGTRSVPVKIKYIHEKWIKKTTGEQYNVSDKYSIELIKHAIHSFKAQYQ